MTAAFVNVSTGAADGSGNSVATGALNVTAGNLIAIFVKWEHSNATLDSVTDTAGNTYTVVAGTKVAHSNGDLKTQIAYAENISGEANNVATAHFSNAAVTYKRVAQVQYSGIATSSPLDDVAVGQGTGTATSTGNLTASGAGLLFAGGGEFNVTTWTAGTNYTERAEWGVTGVNSMVEDRVISSGGSYNATATSGTSMDWAMSLAAFKEAGAAPPVPDIIAGPLSAPIVGPLTPIGY